MLVFIQVSGLITVMLVGSWTSKGISGDLLNLIAGSLIGPMIAIYVGLNRYAPSVPTLSALGLVRPRGRTWLLIALAIVAGAALAPVAVDVTLRLVKQWPLLSAEDRKELVDSESPTNVVVVVALFAQVAGPFVEELLYRGFLQPRLAKTVGAGRAVLLSAMFYVLAEAAPSGFRLQLTPMALAVGAATAVLAMRARCTWVPIAAHVAFQVTQVVLSELGGDLPTFTADSPKLLPLGIVAACAGGAVIALAAAWAIAPREAGEGEPS